MHREVGGNKGRYVQVVAQTAIMHSLGRCSVDAIP